MQEKNFMRAGSLGTNGFINIDETGGNEETGN